VSRWWSPISHPPPSSGSASARGATPTRCCPRGAAPRRLSELLAEARELDPELPTLVALRVVHAVGSSVGTARGQGDPTVLLAFDDGTVLRDPEFGGADLLVTSAGVSAGEPGIEEVA
jgi:hypothetical protein